MGKIKITRWGKSKLPDGENQNYPLGNNEIPETVISRGRVNAGASSETTTENTTQEPPSAQCDAPSQSKQSEPDTKEPAAKAKINLPPKFEPEAFAALWALYQNGDDKKKAVATWDKLCPDETFEREILLQPQTASAARAA